MDTKKDRGAPRFGTELILKRSDVPSAVRKRYDAFANVATGKVEATARKVNGATVYFFHALTDASGEARIVGSSGKIHSKGELTAQGTAPRAAWEVTWT